MKKLVLITALLSLTACGDKVSTNELEEQRGIVRENLLFNAQVYHYRRFCLGTTRLSPNGDSTMSVSCPKEMVGELSNLSALKDVQLSSSAQPTLRTSLAKLMVKSLNIVRKKVAVLVQM